VTTAQPEHIVPRELAYHALRLARHRSRRGRALDAWLRRSTSASYYAVFHALSLGVARQLAPRAAAEDRYRLARSVDHGRVADVCLWVIGNGSGKRNAQEVVADLRRNGDVVEFGDLFLTLQQARHRADYDHLAPVDEFEALTHHRSACRALDLLDALAGTVDRERFLALVALNTALR
jgi:hypothetical protein